MKKTTMLAAIAATTVAACAAPLNPKTATEAECRAVYAHACAMSDVSAAYKYADTNGLMTAILRNDLDALRLEIDEHFAGLGQGGRWWLYAKFPKMSAIDRQSRGFNEKFAKSLALAKRYNTDIRPVVFVESGCTMNEIAECLAEVVAASGELGVGVKFIEGFKMGVQKCAAKHIKRWLRQQGKTFITKNGVNPCEQYLAALNTTLNAPRFEGLDKWLKDFGCAGITISNLPDAAAVNALKEAVLYGDKDMDGGASGTLYVCLGVSGYNAFVREYNGD